MSVKNLREQHRDRLGRELMASAGNLFMKEGYENFTMRKLARIMGCSPGLLYTYFKDKDDLIYRLVEESFEGLLVALDKSVQTKNPIQHIKNIFRAYIDFGLANPNQYYFAFMMQRTRKLQKNWKSPHRSFDILRQAVKACVENKLFNKVDVETASQGLWATVHGTTSLIIANPNFPWIERESLINHIIDRAIQGLSSSKAKGNGKA